MVELFANRSMASDLGLHGLPILHFQGSPDYNGLIKVICIIHQFYTLRTTLSCSHSELILQI